MLSDAICGAKSLGGFAVADSGVRSLELHVLCVWSAILLQRGREAFDNGASAAEGKSLRAVAVLVGD